MFVLFHLVGPTSQPWCIRICKALSAAGPQRLVTPPDPSGRWSGLELWSQLAVFWWFLGIFIQVRTKKLHVYMYTYVYNHCYCHYILHYVTMI